MFFYFFYKIQYFLWKIETIQKYNKQWKKIDSPRRENNKQWKKHYVKMVYVCRIQNRKVFSMKLTYINLEYNLILNLILIQSTVFSHLQPTD